MQNIEVNINEDNNVSTVSVKGEIDIYTCPVFKEKLTSFLMKNVSFILNLEEITYIDSTGLGTIAHIARTLEADQKHINVVCNKPQIVKIFKVAGLEKKNINLYASTNEIN